MSIKIDMNAESIVYDNACTACAENSRERLAAYLDNLAEQFAEQCKP